MTRKLIAATLGLLVGMVLLASPAEAATARRSTLGYNEAQKQCNSPAGGGSCVYTDIGTDLKVHVEKAWSGIVYNVAIPTGCANDSNCTFEYGWVVHDSQPCNQSGSWLGWVTAGQQNVFRVVVNADLDPVANCRIKLIWVDYTW